VYSEAAYGQLSKRQVGFLFAYLHLAQTYYLLQSKYMYDNKRKYRCMDACIPQRLTLIQLLCLCGQFRNLTSCR